jgi:predicted HTH domain antitoxin
MTSIQVELDDEVVRLLRRSEQPVEQWARELIIYELYRRGEITTGKAAELIGMERFSFMEEASRAGIPYFQYDAEDLRAELTASESL